jgi:hypothetical protein
MAELRGVVGICQKVDGQTDCGKGWSVKVTEMKSCRPSVENDGGSTRIDFSPYGSQELLLGAV